jgi:transposase
MYVAIVPNRSSPPAILLRESYREGGKVKKRTLANLSALPMEHVEVLRRALKGETLVPAEEHFEVTRSRPHGHVAAVLGTLRELGLEEVLSTRRHRKRDLVVAMIVARILEPRSKLATARELGGETLASTLGDVVGVGEADADELYEAMDWLIRGQERIEKKLAGRHLAEGGQVLWDVTSTYFEGRHCVLACPGYSRDRRPDRPQIVFGLLTTAEGCPVAVEVFAGNTADPQTLEAAVKRLREEFGLSHVVVVGDRGMITQARITEELRPQGLAWITALRAPQVRQLWKKGPLQLSLFDERDLAEITSPDFPGERLICCRNPLLAEERARKREALLEATEKELEKVRRATLRERGPLQGRDRIGMRVGKVLGRFKVGKHFRLTITDHSLDFERDEEQIGEEAALDGIYVIRTSVTAQELTASEAVEAYKRLSTVERGFRVCKGSDLKVRPIHHRREDRVRAHVFLCMLAHYVRWHMEQRLAPVLFTDHDPEAGQQRRASIVAPAQRSDRADRKASRKRTEEGEPIHSFQTLLRDLATLTKNTVQVGEHITFDQITRPTPLQQRALDLLGVNYRL